MGYKFFKQKKQVATSTKNEFDFHLDFTVKLVPEQ